MRGCGLSLFELINRSFEHTTAPRPFAFPQVLLASLTREQWANWNNSIKRLGREIAYLNVPYHEHSLKDFTKVAFSPNNEIRLKDMLAELMSLLTNLRTLTDSFNDKDGEIVLTEPGLIQLLTKPSLVQALQAILAVSTDHKVMLDLNQETFSKLLELNTGTLLLKTFEAYDAYNKSRLSLAQDYNREVLDLDYIAIKTEFLQANRSRIFRGSKQEKTLASLNIHTRQGFAVTAKNAEIQFDRLSDHGILEQKWQELSVRLDSVFNLNLSSINDPAPILQTMIQIRNILLEVRSEHIEMDTNHAFALYRLLPKLRHIGDTGEGQFVGQIKRFQRVFTDFCELTGVCTSMLSEANEPTALDRKFRTWLDNVDQWKAWSRFCSAAEKLHNLGLDFVIDELKTGEFTVELGRSEYTEKQLFEAFTASLLQALIQYYFESSPSLTHFKGREYEHQISHFNELVDEYEELSREQIRNRLSVEIPDPLTCTPNELDQLAFLKKAIRSKGRGISLRSLFENCSLIIKRLCPVMLMSPLSVAQYIDPSFPKFDLLVFDEASQIRTSNAVGAMSRAKDCIIVGDPNQMPPSSFFKNQKLDEDNLHVEDLESILDDCLSINMPEKHLDWHYRSSSESLIAFSNQMYYKGRMITFPSPRDKESKVSFRYVEGIYDRGHTRTNKLEAMAIVDEVERRLLDPKLRQDSIGIVTFNMSQQEMIDDLLQELFRKNRDLDLIAQKLDEEIFIKNLENVQGDERDVILFSIGYGPAEDGKMSMNFGPLGKKGGWRRLNVAASRSRKEMVVFASFEPENIRVSATLSEGVLGLQQFMLFARDEKLHSSLAKTEVKNKQKIALINSVSSFLKDHGYEVLRDIGKSDLKVDLAVVDPNDNTNMLCALMIDGDRFADLQTARDRYRLVPSVLAGKGWDLYFLWTIDWFEQAESEQRKLLQFLNNCEEKSLLNQAVENKKEEPATLTVHESQIDTATELQGVGGGINLNEDQISKSKGIILHLQQETEELQQVSQIASHNNIIVPSQERSDDGGENPLPLIIQSDYLAYRPVDIFPASDIVDEEGTTNIIREIIALEAPIHEDLLFRRVSAVYSGARLVASTRNLLSRCARQVSNKTTAQAGMKIYWHPNSDPSKYSEYRVHKNEIDQRECAQIPDYELANALLATALENLHSDGKSLRISEEQLMREVAKLMGYSRFIKTVEDPLKRAISRALRLKYFSREGRRLVLLNLL